MSEKILIVDDDPETIHLLNLMLARLGYQALVARDGPEALSLAKSEIPDLIVLDVMMPGMDGFEVANNLRRHPDTATIPILMLTAKTQIEDKVAGYDAGADIYLTKPIHPVDLYANIKTLLTQKRERAMAQAKQCYTVGVIAAKGGVGVLHGCAEPGHCLPSKEGRESDCGGNAPRPRFLGGGVEDYQSHRPGDFTPPGIDRDIHSDN